MVIFSIIVALISLAVCYAGHIEYFKAFAIVFAVGGCIFALFGPSLPSQKFKNAGIFVVLGAAIYLIARFLWK